MALMQSVIEIALEETRKAGATRLRRIALDIGALSAVEPEALRFCFEATVAGTAAEGAELSIRDVEGAGWCPDCGREVGLVERYGACPACGGFRVRMTRGADMKIRELEVA